MRFLRPFIDIDNFMLPINIKYIYILSPCVPLCLGGHTNMNGMLAIDRKIAIIKEETICIWLYLIFIDNKTDIQAVLLSVSRVSV